MTDVLSGVESFITGAATATLVASGAIGFVVGSFLDKWLSRERPEIAITQIEVTNDDIGHVTLSPTAVTLAGRSGWSATLESTEARSTVSAALQRLKTFISWASGDQGIRALKRNSEGIASRELSRDELVELVGSLFDNGPVGKTILGMTRAGKLSLPNPRPGDQVLTVRLVRERRGALFELDLPTRTLGMIVPGATDDETFGRLKKLGEVLRRVDIKILRTVLPQILADVEGELTVAEELAAELEQVLKESEGVPVAAIRISICASNSGDRLAVLAPTARLDIGGHSRKVPPLRVELRHETDAGGRPPPDRPMEDAKPLAGPNQPTPERKATFRGGTRDFIALEPQSAKSVDFVSYTSVPLSRMVQAGEAPCLLVAERADTRRSWPRPRNPITIRSSPSRMPRLT